MAEKIKKTRPELLRQRRQLAMFKRFLPTLVLKKQQLQMEILKVRAEQDRERARQKELIDQVAPWVAVLAEGIPGPVTRLVKVKAIETGEKNVAGIKLPMLARVEYTVLPYSLTAVPPWVDAAVGLVKNLLEMGERLKVLKMQEKVLQKELRKVTQRVNLFEKVMIPQAQENIRVVRIALAEEQTAGVGRAKIAKNKLAEAFEAAAEDAAASGGIEEAGP
jgi:V/A-type H+/Na+-transporting ATPase subunit D